MNDFRTPLNRVRGLGSAREGTGHFWRQRLSSIALLPLSFFVVGWIVSLRGAGFAEVRASLAQPLVTLVVALFLVIGLDHMRLGMKEIIEDYTHHEGSKLALMVLNTFFTVAVGVVSIFALLKLAFGG
ncbi:succinate dehydrogenase [Mesorhizobium sp. Root554]|uniref:succinate dehydrogenase, hydrophobic membrane anchor protein n=1 Tax=unclassified Mesorhizobium TaxID=325217 RepID=UPI0006F291E7|nr:MULTISPECIES: succinate dehydrogenase, hydrophobic membrane anchor protein [unclassified Mesorhizobium]KQZ15028.1 succinate dehydrogenase [Mesorhizobium sp. Root1471]KQZ37538.1 succinate dehydrogenase [Mesorhizobium sp. Root554]